MIKVSNVFVMRADEINPNWSGFVITAETRRGEAFILDRYDLSLPQCERLVQRIQVAGAINEDRWSFWRTIYGSKAFEEEEAELAALLAFGVAENDLPDRLRELA